MRPKGGNPVRDGSILGGLRLRDLKSSLGRVIFLNVAWPLVREPNQDRWQVIFGNRVQF
jgi:hypothetical protein